MKLYIDPVTIGLAILLFGSVLSDKFEAKQERRELKTQIDASVKLSNAVVTLSSNNLQTSQQLNNLILEKSTIDKKYEKQLAQQEAEVGKQFGIVTSQAASIASSTPCDETIRHYKTSEMFMNLHNGAMIDQQLSWNNSYISNTTNDYEILKKELENTRKENLKLQNNLEKTSTENVTLSTQLNGKSLELEKSVGKISLVENLLYTQKGWASKLKSILYTSIILTIIGGIVYIGFHIWQLKQKNKDINDIREKLREEADRRRLANTEKYSLEKQANELKTSIKTFFNVDDSGNSTMKKILESNGLKKHFEDVIQKEEDKKSS